MTLQTWLAFVATSIVVLVIPGPTIVSVVSHALTHGRRARAAVVAAVALGDATALLTSLLGLGGLLAASAFWFDVVKWLGGLCLLHLGLRMLRAPVRASRIDAREERGPGLALFTRMYLVTTLNPKGIVFYAVVVPQFIEADASLNPQLAVLVGTFVALATLNAALYATFADRARGLFASVRAQRRLNLLGGSLLSGAGIWSLLSRRAI